MNAGGGGCSSTLSLMVVLDGVGGQCHDPAALIPGKRTGTCCTGGWVSPRACLDECRKSCPPPGLDLWTVLPVVSCISTVLSWLSGNVTTDMKKSHYLMSQCTLFYSILWNNQQMQLYAVNFIPLLGSLYMFRVFYTPIIRSTIFNCIYSPWYKP